MWVINIIIDAGLRPKADVYFLLSECGKRCGSAFQGSCWDHTYVGGGGHVVLSSLW